MKVTKAQPSVVVFPLATGLIGRVIATAEDETNGKRYAFIEQWQVPWGAPVATPVGFGVWDLTATGEIDLSKMSDAVLEVVAAVEKAGLKPHAARGRT